MGELFYIRTSPVCGEAGDERTRQQSEAETGEGARRDRRYKPGGGQTSELTGGTTKEL